MARRLPSLNGLKAFESAARLESFSRAADELCVTHAAISRHIRELEATLKAQLFERTGRGVRLTTAGEELSRDLTQAFGLMTVATARFSAGTLRRKRLTVSADVSFAALWLVPRLGRFTAAYPSTDVLIDADHRLVDLNKEDVDIAIRYGTPPWRGTRSAKLADSRLTLVCSPARFAKDTPKSPRALNPALLIRETAKEQWHAWLAAAGVADAISPSGPTLNGDLAMAAAIAGQGYALADQVQAGDAQLAGRLIQPFDVSIVRQGYNLVRAAGAKASKPAADFAEWLHAEMARMEQALTDRALAARKPKPR
jgi:LysR family transcriptional regulator, glycine cleavage system transcriptional activator